MSWYPSNFQRCKVCLLVQDAYGLLGEVHMEGAILKARQLEGKSCSLVGKKILQKATRERTVGLFSLIDTIWPPVMPLITTGQSQPHEEVQADLPPPSFCYIFTAHPNLGQIDIIEEHPISKLCQPPVSHCLKDILQAGGLGMCCTFYARVIYQKPQLKSFLPVEQREIWLMVTDITQQANNESCSSLPKTVPIFVTSSCVLGPEVLAALNVAAPHSILFRDALQDQASVPCSVQFWDPGVLLLDVAKWRELGVEPGDKVETLPTSEGGSHRGALEDLAHFKSGFPLGPGVPPAHSEVALQPGGIGARSSRMPQASGRRVLARGRLLASRSSQRGQYRWRWACPLRASPATLQAPAAQPGAAPSSPPPPASQEPARDLRLACVQQPGHRAGLETWPYSVSSSWACRPGPGTAPASASAQRLLSGMFSVERSFCSTATPTSLLTTSFQSLRAAADSCGSGARPDWECLSAETGPSAGLLNRRKNSEPQLLLSRKNLLLRPVFPCCDMSCSQKAPAGLLGLPLQIWVLREGQELRSEECPRKGGGAVKLLCPVHSQPPDKLRQTRGNSAPQCRDSLCKAPSAARESVNFAVWLYGYLVVVVCLFVNNGQNERSL
ncbi:LOW QUALITY PROTEIN: uncharacterized protein ACIGJ3_018789 [Trichechus inunguis]